MVEVVGLHLKQTQMLTAKSDNESYFILFVFHLQEDITSRMLEILGGPSVLQQILRLLCFVHPSLAAKVGLPCYFQLSRTASL